MHHPAPLPNGRGHGLTLWSTRSPESEEYRDQYEAMGNNPFQIYMSLLFLDGERRWFQYNRQVLDSVFGKNERDGAMRQPLGGRRRRRAAISPALLETLVLVAMVRFDGLAQPMDRDLSGWINWSTDLPTAMDCL